MKVIAEKPIIHPNALDIYGKEFRYDHAKGVAELLKNSIDAYSIDEIKDDDQEVYILFLLHKENIKSIMVLDFVGMTRKKIDEAYKVWFDPSASKLDADAIKKEKLTLGGHGNGGKFYLRQMFNSSKIITYIDGRLNVFGFNENKQYGFYEGYKDVRKTLEEAITVTGLEENFPVIDQLKEIIKNRKRFSLIIGEGPKSIQQTNKIKPLIEKLISHPQARRLIQRKKIYYATNSLSKAQQLIVPRLTPRQNFEKPFEFDCPQKISYEGEEVLMFKQQTQRISLKLNTSDEPLKGIKYKGLNSIDFLGEVGVLANYEIHELGNYFKSFIYSDFIYGECFCPSMQDENEDYVRNDRSKFTDGPKKEALLKWVLECVENVCVKMDEQLKKEKHFQNLSQASELNKLLNKWKNRFLQKLLKEKLGGIGDFGIEGSKEPGWSGSRDKSSSNKSGKRTGDQGGSEKKRGSSFPEVLISGKDKDPDTGEIVECDARNNAIYQRPIDEKRGIYWINTSKKYAQHIFSRFGPESVRFREYMFQRYIDIIVTEYLIYLGKVEVNLTSDIVTREIDKKISDILDNAVEDLEKFLFEEEYNL